MKLRWLFNGSTFHRLHRAHYWLRNKHCFGCRLRSSGPYQERDLVFSATSRCICGAGLAHLVRTDSRGSWDCADILMGKAIPKGVVGSVLHTSKLPFAFYEVKSEHQPSARGATTR